MKRNSSFMISPTEAVDIVGYSGWATVARARKIVDAYQAREYTRSWGTSMLYAVLYNAGRIDGIRQERARRKARKGEEVQHV